MFDFSGKYAVVTGGSRGIGEAIVKRFVADNAAGVAILDLLDAPYTKELDPSGERVFPLVADISDREAVRSSFQQIYDRFGRVDFMINNAGVTRDAMFHKMNDENWDTVVDVNLGGSYNCTRQVINKMREQESGRIVFVSSIAIYGAAAGLSNYAAAKSALIALTRTLALEQHRKSITVNCVIPGGIDTDMVTHLKDLPKDLRMGKPEEVASLICYLCTDEASFISGACIDINGGLR